MDDLPAKLTRYRARRGETLKALAGRWGVPLSTMDRWSSRGAGDGNTARVLAALLDEIEEQGGDPGT
jgi:hypothetical protein